MVYGINWILKIDDAYVKRFIMNELLKVENLKICANEKNSNVTIVDNISFDLRQGETLGIVGESGCGKSITALSIMGLLKKKLHISKGKILFNDNDIASMDKNELRKLCGKDIGMIFQEPMTALNPLFTIGRQLAEPLLIHMNLTKEEAYKRSIELLAEVGIKNPQKVMKSYPHQFSGGMRQRVLIAIAISCNPSLLIADEPTTALDVIIQAQILKILRRMIKERNMSLLLISHDFGVISQMAERVAVMYSGEIVEEGKIENIIKRPNHPYTKELLGAAKEMSNGCEVLTVVKGSVPRPEHIIEGCRFAERCRNRKPICDEKRPPYIAVPDDSAKVKCWNFVHDSKNRSN